MQKRYILITGGQLFNKGAQAMTFISVDELSRRYPDREVIVLSNKDYRRSAQEKAKYAFQIMRYPKTKQMILMQYHLGKLFYGRMGDEDTKKFLDVLKNTDAVVDVSGYALGSNWGEKKTVFYLTVIGLARSVGARVYLMPQSFGPFAYKGPSAPFIQKMLRRRLRYPRVIMCREQEGYELLKNKYHLNNLRKEPDLVLQNTGVDVRRIYGSTTAGGNAQAGSDVAVGRDVAAGRDTTAGRDMAAGRDTTARRDVAAGQDTAVRQGVSAGQILQVLQIPEGSVAIIPNQKTIQYGREDQLFHLYRSMTELLLEQGKRVFLVYHSAEDLPICRKIKEDYFAERAEVQVVEQELSCLEFDAMVKQFDYIIASRFHAIVHAYRNGVPAIVLGWATKYRELLGLFSLERFLFDVRRDMDDKALLEAVRDMERQYELISIAIKEKLVNIQRENVYDYLDLR